MQYNRRWSCADTNNASPVRSTSTVLDGSAVILPSTSCSGEVSGAVDLTGYERVWTTTATRPGTETNIVRCAPEKISPSRRARDGARPRASAYTGAIEFSAARTAEPNNVRTFPVSARRAHLFNGGGHASYASEVRCAATTPRCERAFQFQFDDGTFRFALCTQ